MRLLVVEDEPTTREFLERGLREEAFRVRAVADATWAEACALAEGFDAITLGVMLPDATGSPSVSAANARNRHAHSVVELSARTPRIGGRCVLQRKR